MIVEGAGGGPRRPISCTACYTEPAATGRLVTCLAVQDHSQESRSPGRDFNLEYKAGCSSMETKLISVVKCFTSDLLQFAVLVR